MNKFEAGLWLFKNSNEAILAALKMKEILGKYNE